VNKLASEQVCHSLAQFSSDNYHHIGVFNNMEGEVKQIRPWVLGTLIYKYFKLERMGRLV
jgi:hypothetical protein